MAVVLRSVRAAKDLIEIWHYIAEDNPAAADRVLLALERRIDLLTRHPWSGASREEFGLGIRGLVSLPYLILYRVELDGVRIVRVMHGSRGIGVEDLVE
jgi:toxin ParE1/3/4